MANDVGLGGRFRRIELVTVQSSVNEVTRLLERTEHVQCESEKLAKAVFPLIMWAASSKCKVLLQQSSSDDTER